MRRRSGQTATEYMLILSVLVISVVAAAYVFVPQFQSGVVALSGDVSRMLATGQVGGIGFQRHAAGGGAAATASAPVSNSGATNSAPPSFGGRPNIAGANSLNESNNDPITGGLNGG